MPTPPSRRPAQAKAPPYAAVLGHGDLATSLLFIFPLFLLYEVGVLYTPAMNGVDFVSRNVFAALDFSRAAYLSLHLVLAALYACLLVWLRRRDGFSLRRFVPILLESGIYALTLGSLILFVMRKLGIEPSLALSLPSLSVPLAASDTPSGLTAIIVSIGAGVHEELVFRLGVCAGGAAILRLLGLRHVAAVAVAFVISSLLFSAAHHLGAAGEPFTVGAFTYRFFAGLVFATIFHFRSLATAAYTHALYDVYVLVLT